MYLGPCGLGHDCPKEAGCREHKGPHRLARNEDLRLVGWRTELKISRAREQIIAILEYIVY